MAGLARPVRTVARSSLATDTALSIFSSASKRVSSITATPCPAGAWAAWPLPVSPLTHFPGEPPDRRVSHRGTDQGPDRFAAHRTCDVAFGEQIEHDDR